MVLIEPGSWLGKTLDAMGAQAFRWEEVRRLGLVPVVGEWKRTEWRALPAAIRGQRFDILKRKLFLRTVTAQLVEALGGAEISVIVEKGEPLGEEIFPTPSMRSSGDIDLLVLPGDLEAVGRILEKLGYRPKVELSAAVIQTNKQWVFVHQEHGAVVELHWQILLPAMPLIPLGPLFDTRREFLLDGRTPVPVLREDWLLLYLAIHFYGHSGYARGLVDIAAWLDTFAASEDYGELMERCRELGVYGILQWPLHTLYELSGERPPLYGDDVDWTVRWWSRISARVLRGCMSRTASTTVERSLQQISSEMGSKGDVAMQCLLAGLVDGMGRKLRYMPKAVLLGPHRYGRRLVGWWQ